MTRRGLLKASVRSGIGASGAALGAFAWSYKVEPNRLQVEPLELKLSRLRPAFDGYRIVQISDLHCDNPVDIVRMRRAVEVINGLQPDMVVITGDFISDHPQTFARDIPSVLSRLATPDGVWGVLGNHDYWTDAELVRHTLQRSNVRELRNDVHLLRRDQSTLALAGLDDYWEKKADFPGLLNKLPQADATILLQHEPDFADISAKTGRFDVQLSGHSHAGQVRMPFFGPIHLPQYGQKYHTGLYRVREMWQYTNRGLGTVGINMRFCCPPEITLLTLRAGAKV